MCIAINVDASGMVDALMLIAVARQRPIDARFIGENDSARHDAFSEIRQDCARLCIRHHARYHAAFALDSAPDRLRAYWTPLTRLSLAPMLVTFFAATITFIGFHFGRQFRTVAIFIKQ